MRDTSHSRLAVFIGLVVLGAQTRLIPHPPNFTSVLAVGLFAGAYLRREFPGRAWAVYFIPLLSMAVGDLFLGWHSLVPVTYLAVMLSVVLGRFSVGEDGAFRTAGFLAGSIVSSSVFYLISNFGVWLGGTLYPMTGAGLIACYVSGLPFFGNMLAGTFLFGGALFGLGMFAERLIVKTVATK